MTCGTVRRALRRVFGALPILTLACAPSDAPTDDERQPMPSIALRPDPVPSASRAPAPPSTARASGTVDRAPCVVAAVTDGDSFRCRDGQRVRLLLLDAPEMDQGPFGIQARDALRTRLRRNDTAWLEYDVQREDRYGRTLAYVYPAARGGTSVNLTQARDGWAVAVVFPPNVRDIARIRAAVAEAREARRGLWADGRFTCEPIAHKRGDC